MLLIPFFLNKEFDSLGYGILFMLVLRLFGLIMKIPLNIRFRIGLEGLILHLSFTDVFALKVSLHLSSAEGVGSQNVTRT
jgi:hypothetical protein